MKVEAAKQLAMQSSRLRYCRLFLGPFINYVVVLRGGGGTVCINGVCADIYWDTELNIVNQV